MEGGKKKWLCVFFGLTKDRVLVEKCVLGHPIARATSYYFLPDGDISSDYGPPKMPLKLAVLKFANSLSPPSIVKKVRTGNKSSQGT